MIYSTRLKQIIRLLLQQSDGEYISVGMVSEKLNVSRRTIFRELEAAPGQLDEYPMEIDSKKSKGIRLLIEDGQREEIERKFLNSSEGSYSKKERRLLLAYEIISTDEIQKLSYYGDIFQVSVTTISNDLDSLEPQFEKFGLALDRSSKNRIELHGSEAGKRSMMSYIIHHQISNIEQPNKPMTDSKTHFDGFFKKNENPSILSLFNQEVLDQLLNLFDENFHALSLEEYAPSSLAALIIHLAVAIERIRKHEPISERIETLSFIKDDPAYKQAEKIAGVVEEAFEISMEEGETAFIAIHLKGAKKASTLNTPEINDQDKEIACILLDGFDIETQTRLLADPEFLQGLCAHLNPALIRIKNKMPIYNPLLEDIKMQYQDLYEATLKALDYVYEQTGIHFSEPEAGFITMHVGAALERNKKANTPRPIRCSIVCASGIGVSALLAAKMQLIFGSLLKLQTKSFDDVLSQRLEDTELLISTFHIDSPSIPFIEVSALLPDTDIEKVKAAICQIQNENPNAPEKTNFDLIENLNRMQEASKTSLEILENYRSIEVPADLTPAKAIEIISKNVKGDQERVRKDLTEREKLGSVIAEDFGFALFHCVSKGTDESHVLVLYPEAAGFTSKLYKNIRFIICEIAPVQRETARAIFGKMSGSLVEKTRLYQALNEHNDASVRKALGEIIGDYIQSFKS